MKAAAARRIARIDPQRCIGCTRCIDACPFDASGHLAMAVDPNVNLLIRRALDPAHAPPLRCSWVFPAPF